VAFHLGYKLRSATIMFLVRHKGPPFSIGTRLRCGSKLLLVRRDQRAQAEMAHPFSSLMSS
jgi:hypothetical protein